MEFAVTFYLCSKIKRKVREMHSRHGDRETASFKDALLGHEDEYTALRIKQINMLLLAFTISMLTGMVEVIYMSFENDQIVCVKDGISYLRAKTALGSVALYFKDVAQLVPHIFVPVILYFLPARRKGVKLGVILMSDLGE